MIRPPPRSTLTYTLVPHATLVISRYLHAGRGAPDRGRATDQGRMRQAAGARLPRRPILFRRRWKGLLHHLWDVHIMLTWPKPFPKPVRRRDDEPDRKSTRLNSST